MLRKQGSNYYSRRFKRQSRLGLVLLTIFHFVYCAKVETVRYNYYPWRYNFLTATLKNLPKNLPPESSNLTLPDLIDNRGRSPIDSPIPISSADLHPAYQFTRASNGQRTNVIKVTPENNVAEMLPNQVIVSDMSCQNNADDLYFRVTLSFTTNARHPIIENASSNACKVTKHQNTYRVDFGKDEFWNCGVLDCSTDWDRHYCLKVRFPTITGLRLKDDFEVTLQCRARKNVASQTRRFNLKSIDTTAKMAPRVATGGHKSAFQTDLALYRKTFDSENIFNSKIESGGTVVLGEELLLRATVRDGDGWKYSKISDVTVHYVNDKQRKEITNSLWILDGDGCLNPRLAEINLGEQYRVEALESQLIFKAFMFDGMQETDEMVLTVKITGCLRGQDCTFNCPAEHVRKASQVARSRRELRTSINDNRTIDWQNDITFKVIASSSNLYRINKLPLILTCLLSVTLLVILTSLVCIIQVFAKKGKVLYGE